MSVNPNQSWRAIFAATATIGAVGIALGLGQQLIALLMTERHFSDSVIGYSGTVGGLATIIAAACTSRIALKFGVVPPILTMLAIGTLSFLGFYYFQSIWIWFGLRFTLHFAMTVMFILSEFWVNHSAPPHRRGMILAIYAITLGLGFAAGPAILTHVGSTGFIPYGTGIVIIALAAIPILAAWSISPRFEDHEHVTFLPFIFKVPTSTMAVFVYGAIQLGALTLITPFAVKQLNVSGEVAAHYTFLLTFGNVLLLVPIGMISDHLKDRRIALMGCALIGLAGTLAVPFVAYNHILLSIDLFILGGVSGGLYTIGLAQLGTRLKGHELAAANSAFIFCYGVGMLFGPTFIGKAMDYFPPYGFSYSMAIFFGLYVLLVVSRLFGKLFRS